MAVIPCMFFFFFFFIACLVPRRVFPFWFCHGWERFGRRSGFMMHFGGYLMTSWVMESCIIWNQKSDFQTSSSSISRLVSELSLLSRYRSVVSYRGRPCETGGYLVGTVASA